MKRTIACVLAFVMLFGLPVFAEEPAAKAVKEQREQMLLQTLIYGGDTQESASMGQLKALGIVKSDRTGSHFTRAEMAYAAAVLLLMEEGAGGTTPIYTDVKPSYWAYRQITYLAQMGILSSYFDGSFEPENTATVEQMAKVFVGVLGYADRAENMGGYPNGYLTVAASLGLLNGIDMQETALTAEQAASFLHNVLQATPLLMEYGTPGNYTTDTQKLLDSFLQYHGYQMIEGIVTGNRDTSLTQGIARSNSIEIDGVSYRTADTAAHRLLGFHVQAVLDDDQETILGLYAQGNEQLVVWAEEIVSATANTLTYINQAEKKRDARLKNAKLVYNGKLMSSYLPRDLQIQSGFIQLVDHDNDGMYDVIFVNSYDSYLVESVTDDSIRYQEADVHRGVTGLLFEMEDPDFRYALYDADGQAISIDAVKADTVITVFSSKDGKLHRIFAGGDAVTGSVEEINDDAIRIAGTEYPYAVTSTGKVTIDCSVGDEGTFYLDLFHDVFYFETPKTANEHYAYLIQSTSNVSLNTQIQVKLALSGLIGSVQSSEYSWVNESMVKNSQVAIYQLAEKVRISQNGENGKSYTGDELGSIIQNHLHSVLSFRLNSAGEISRINLLTAPDLSIPDGYFRHTTKSIRTMSPTFTADHNAAIKLTGDSNCLAIPTAAGDYSDEDYLGEYRIKDASSNNVVDIYGFDPDTLTGELLVFSYENYSENGFENSSSSSNPSIIAAAAQVLDEQGDSAWQVSYYLGGQLHERLFDGKVTMSRSAIEQIRPGDIAIIHVSGNNWINEIEVVEVAENLPAAALTDTKACGSMVDVKTDYIWEGNNDDFFNVFYVDTGSQTVAVPYRVDQPVYLYTKRLGKVEMIDLNTLLHEGMTGAIPDKLYCRTQAMYKQADIIIAVR